MAQRFGTNHPIYDASRLMAFATGISPDNSPNAPIDAEYVTMTAAAGLPSERVLTSGRRMLLTDGGAGSTVTLGVVDTRKLIVDAAGYGDYTTIQAALDYIATAGGGRFRVEIRNNDSGVYAERLTLQPTQDNLCAVEVVGDTNVSINAAVDTTDDDSLIVGQYANMTFRNLRFIPSGTPSNNSAMITGMNGNSSIAFYDCQIAPRPNQKLASGNGVLYFFHCTLGANATNYTYGVVGTPGVSTLLFYLWDCLVIGNAAANVGLVDCNNGNTIALYHCVIDNGGAGYDLDENNVAGSITVVRCAYDRTNTNGTITVLDGDIPALTVADIPAHSLLSTTHGDTTAASPPTRGDIITAQGASPLWSRLAKGAANTILQMGADEPGWSTSTLTLGGNSSINGAAIVGTPGTLTVATTNSAPDPHTHAITSSSAPGAAASIVATDAAGKTTLQVLNIPTTASLAVGTIQQNGTVLVHTFGTENTFIGNGSGPAGNLTLSGATYNVGIGRNALLAITSGDNNIMVGYGAGDSITTGTSNVALGVSALSTATVVSDNFALGYQALLSCDSASGDPYARNNVAIGSTALRQLTSGYAAIGIGRSAAYNASTAYQFVAIGYRAAYGASAASAPINSVIIGSEAAYSGISTGLTSGAVLIGTYAGYTGTAHGGSILIGFSAGYYETGTNKLFIDNAARTNEATAREQAFIYGDIAAGLHQFNSVTTTNNAALEVLRLQVSNSTASTGGANGFGPALDFYAETSVNGTYRQLSRIVTTLTDATDATHTSKIVFSNVVSGTLTEVLALDSTGVVVNEGGLAGVDFRAESDTEANMLLVDASANKMYCGGTTNGIEISAGGDLLLLGTAIRERHIQIPATPSGTVASQMDNETYGTAVGLQASSTVNQYAGCQWEVPDDWAGDDCYIEIDWLPNSGAMSGADTVEWVVEYRSIAEGEVITTGTVATVTATVSDDLSQGQTKHSRMTLTYNHANQPLAKQDHVYFLVHRNTGVANDFSGTAFVTAYEIIYNSNSFPTSN